MNEKIERWVEEWKRLENDGRLTGWKNGWVDG